MKKQIYYTAITITLVLLVMELSYINSKSLLYLVAESGIVDRIFAIIGALAFSLVTVLVMRTTDNRWMRIIFPVFDAMLVFGGFNVRFANNLLDNPVAFALTVFYALFVFVIMHGLGKISYNMSGNVKNASAKRLNEAKRIIDEMKKELNDYKCTNEDLKRINDEMRHMAERFLQSHILYEAWISKKKTEQNRNGYDSIINRLAGHIRDGNTVTIDDYIINIKKQ